MKIEIKNFNELTNTEIYNILKIRAEVFVVEQNCLYNDIDDKDLEAIHMFIKEGSNIVAYLRVLKKCDEKISFGRVLVERNSRKKGYAIELISKALNLINEKWPEKNIIIEAQSYLKKFYESFSFKAIKSEHLEDGIPHYWMEKS
ncbi:GNAT family N-acetyltransferase [Arcobacter roscoffensis]|uniref:GNAT family N-acetyltransferase n=1 Tax=Arcobacter roscoffensis TaxID=2961520 RepID=A0ABY5E661_9BACT|nr:GNAT family N-acetyltransferase [Arcobacter roscoffensis]UTJ06251.1 GNAT family N-acetyltransferase [Arcobacter roscoffensis]